MVEFADKIERRNKRNTKRREAKNKSKGGDGDNSKSVKSAIYDKFNTNKKPDPRPLPSMTMPDHKDILELDGDIEPSI